jgi:hypothetical protein
LGDGVGLRTIGTAGGASGTPLDNDDEESDDDNDDGAVPADSAMIVDNEKAKESSRGL